jgi:UbiD family decarboxylase
MGAIPPVRQRTEVRREQIIDLILLAPRLIMGRLQLGQLQLQRRVFLKRHFEPRQPLAHALDGRNDALEQLIALVAHEAPSLDPRGAPTSAPITQAIKYVDCRLSDLPLITYSERDAAPYFTSAMFLAKEPETGVQNLSFHRSMYVSDDELRCRLAPRHHLTLYHEKAERAG